jgi:hypothetical protein
MPGRARCVKLALGGLICGRACDFAETGGGAFLVNKENGVFQRVLGTAEFDRFPGVGRADAAKCFREIFVTHGIAVDFEFVVRGDFDGDDVGVERAGCGGGRWRGGRRFRNGGAGLGGGGLGAFADFLRGGNGDFAETGEVRYVFDVGNCRLIGTVAHDERYFASGIPVAELVEDAGQLVGVFRGTVHVELVVGTELDDDGFADFTPDLERGFAGATGEQEEGGACGGTEHGAGGECAEGGIHFA